MRLLPNSVSTTWPEGRRGEEARRPHICCAPSPRPPTLFDRPSVQLKPKRSTPKGVPVPPAEDTGGADGSGGEASSGAQADAVEQPLATESNSTSVNEQPEYESTGARSGVSHSALSAKNGSQQPQRRTRTSFSLEQVQKLEQIFQKQNYLAVPERREVAALLGLAEEQVKNWFQNRRMKFKREHQDPWQQQAQWKSFLPSAPLSSYNPGVLPNFFQDFPMYPQQIAPPYIPNSGLQSSSSCPLYQPPFNPPYPFIAPGLPYHFPPHLLMHPGTQYEADSMFSPNFAE